MNFGFGFRFALPGRIALLALVSIGSSGSLFAGTKLLRFPDVQGGNVVFSYGGDLWTATTSGGTATRLTAHPGLEVFAKYSPDGKWIAFTGQYDGDEQVYVVAATGGEPRQLTYYPAAGPLPPRWGYDNQVYGWTPDGKSVLFRSLRDADGVKTLSALYTVPVAGGVPQQLPMPTSGAGDFAPDGRRLVYSPLVRDFRTWKRYEGGWAQDLYLFDPKDDSVVPVSHSVRTERDPMWIGDAIYFVSDRDNVLNIYRFDIASAQTSQVTAEKTWDVRWASSDNRGEIVYELDGELSLLDVATGKARRLDIVVPDDGVNRRPSRISAAGQIEDFELSPAGERALFVARGDVFSAPIEKGATRNLTASSRAHDKHARWSPDSKSIAYISDATGEDQVYVVAQAGGTPVALTSGIRAMLSAPHWSPDARKIAFGDHNGKLRVVDVASHAMVEIADDEFGGIADAAWSPDSQFLAFALGDLNGTNSIWIWKSGEQRARRVTDDLFDEVNPVWDPNGKYLYYVSTRQFAPQISQIEWNFAGNRMNGIFALTLAADGPSPFPVESDEVKLDAVKAGASDKAEDKKPGKKDADKSDADDKTPVVVEVDFDGLASRVSRIPIEADNIGGLAAAAKYLVYTVSGAPFYGRESYEVTSLRLFDFAERKSSTLVDELDNWALARDGSQVLVEKGSSFERYEVKPKGAEKKSVSTAGLVVDRVPAEEWAEIFDEVWRRYRDFFYVDNMHGYDWKAIGERYRTWLPSVAHRSDLNYVIGEMIAELSIGHAYIAGGDFQLPDRPKVGLPGARFELDKSAGRFRLAKIFRGENAEAKYRAPLAEVGVNAKEGDYVLAIDGVDLAANDNPYRLLRYKTDPVTLTLNSQPGAQGSRKVTYKPIFSESALLYDAFVEHSRKYVAEKTGGRVGYIHIPDMGGNGAYEFIKWFYPQIRKEGMVVDVRSNGGGNISQWIIERLDTELLGTRFGYSSDYPQTYPYTVFYGHLVCLLSETSASDGDIFPARFKKAGLGPLIGKRSWGGVVGISDSGPLVDGGIVFVPQQATNDVDGSYIIEGHGVDPDIEVENDPASVIAGKDPQLDRGIAEVLAAMEREPRHLPKRPADPVKAP
ncbi:MAG: S41 family peptidase [Thermoanaerobaculia bacterium]